MVRRRLDEMAGFREKRTGNPTRGSRAKMGTRGHGNTQRLIVQVCCRSSGVAAAATVPSLRLALTRAVRLNSILCAPLRVARVTVCLGGSRLDVDG